MRTSKEGASTDTAPQIPLLLTPLIHSRTDAEYFLENITYRQRRFFDRNPADSLQAIFPYKVPSVAFGLFLKDKAMKKWMLIKAFRGAKQWENRLFLLVSLPALAFTGVSDLRTVTVLKSGHCTSWVMLRDLNCLSSLTSLSCFYSTSLSNHSLKREK